MGKNKDGLVWKSDVVKKLQEHVGVPAKVWAGMLIRWLDEIEDFEKPESDLIRRQDAIELIENESIKWGDEYGVSDVLCDLSDMPSAQPSPCEFCKHNDISDDVACLMCSAERGTDG